MAQRHAGTKSAASFSRLRRGDFARLQLGRQRGAVDLHLLLGALQVGEPGFAILGRRELLDALDGQRRRDDIGSDDVGGARCRQGSGREGVVPIGNFHRRKTLHCSTNRCPCEVSGRREISLESRLFSSGRAMRARPPFLQLSGHSIPPYQPVGSGLVVGIGDGIGGEVFRADCARLAPCQFEGLCESVGLFGLVVEDFEIGGPVEKLPPPSGRRGAA